MSQSPGSMPGRPAVDARKKGGADQEARAADRPRRNARRRQFVPPQHGAWAMLLAPYLAGLIVAGYRWPDLPLLGAWIAGYMLSYYVFQAVKSRRPRRYRKQLLTYATVAAPLVVLAVAPAPQVLLYAPAYAGLFAINAWYAWRRRERALVNDTASVVQSCLMVLVVASVAGAPAGHAVTAFGLCLGYFLGTVLYVKTMIRERGNVRYRRVSVAYHLIAVLAAAWVSPWAAAVFAWLLVRAALLPGRALTPKQVGLVEIANSALLLICVALL